MEEQKQLQQTDIKSLTAEILILKQQTAQNIIEIGKRLIQVKESLPHGKWGKYLLEEVSFTQRTAQKFMKIAEEFSNTNAPSYLGSEKLWLLLDLPSEERGDFIQNNNVESMSTRELQKAIKEKNKAEEDIKQLLKEKNELEIKLNEEKNKPPKKIEVEVDNTDYTVIQKNKELENKINKIQQEKNNLETKLQLMTDKADAYVQDSEAYQKMKEDITYLTKQKDDLGRQIMAITDISGLVIEVDNLIKNKLAPIRYSKSLLEAKDDEIVIRNLSEIIESVEQWCYEIKQFLPINNKIIINNMEV